MAASRIFVIIAGRLGRLVHPASAGRGFMSSNTRLIYE